MGSTSEEAYSKNLQEKKTNLANWLDEANDQEVESCLAYETKEQVHLHLHVIEDSLEKINNHSLGYCEICNGKIEPSLVEYDYTTSICLDCMAPEDREALQNELDLSESLHQALYSKEIPPVPGLEMAVFSRPAQVFSGDFFDVIQLKNDSFGLVVADAMGHGLSASFLMTSLQTAFRTLLVDRDVMLEDVLTRIHRLFLHNVKYTVFATAFLGSYDPPTRTFTYASAGHPPPLHYLHRDSTIQWLGPTGPAIGILEDYAIHSRAQVFEPGDILVLYSDGVTEASNPAGTLFGKERLAELVLKNRHSTASEISKVIRQELNQFTSGKPLEDDTTLGVFRVGE